MSEPFKACSAVFPIILRDDGREILLHLRQNTGYCDGYWDTAASGHVDEGESAKQAAIRECKEEIGVDVKVDNLEFVHLSHHADPNMSYYHLYFYVNHYEGVPAIMEPEKAAELKWFNLNKLPEGMIPVRKKALEAWCDDVMYTEVIGKRLKKFSP